MGRKNRKLRNLREQPFPDAHDLLHDHSEEEQFDPRPVNRRQQWQNPTAVQNLLNFAKPFVDQDDPNSDEDYYSKSNIFNYAESEEEDISERLSLPANNTIAVPHEWPDLEQEEFKLPKSNEFPVLQSVQKVDHVVKENESLRQSRQWLSRQQQNSRNQLANKVERILKFIDQKFSPGLGRVPYIVYAEEETQEERDIIQTQLSLIKLDCIFRESEKQAKLSQSKDSISAQKLKQLENQNQNLLVQLKKVNFDIETLQKQHKEEKDTQTSIIESLENEIARLQNQVSSLQSELAIKENELGTISQDKISGLNIPQCLEVMQTLMASMSRIQRQISNRYDLEQDSDKCVICTVNERCMVIRPCNHFCMCQECERQLGECPICRKRKTGQLKVHNV